MKIQWCAVIGEAWKMDIHDLPPCEWGKSRFGDSPGEHERCGPMRLIPDDAVDRIAKAMWIAPFYGEVDGAYVHRVAVAVLAVLDGETP